MRPCYCFLTMSSNAASMLHINTAPMLHINTALKNGIIHQLLISIFNIILT